MSELERRLAELSPAKRALLEKRLALEAQSGQAIAIIGMGCRLPGAANPRQLWELLRDGRETVGEVPASRWDAERFYHPNVARPGRMNTRRGGFLPDVDRFDARFFGLAPSEASRLDPQQRLLLEVAWEALEDAALCPATLAGSRTAVFAGVFMDDYRRLQLAAREAIDGATASGTLFSLVANRISYFFDFHGPSMALDTACSSSLVAVHLACRSLRSGEAELALAGGVNLLLTPEPTIEATKAGVMAPDGRSKAFDARADGYVRGEGAGLVVLKPLARALADGDSIYAVIRGTAVNHDGRSNGLTAPSRAAQQAVLEAAYREAGVEPAKVQYVEAHGSGTQLGDAIEAQALGAVMGRGRSPARPCRIGSIKTNIGHVETAAGVAALIKTALCLHHRQLPPSLHFETPNPHIAFAELGLVVQTALEPWPATDEPALAGVSAFGYGGTNAHAVLAEAPPPTDSAPGRPVCLLTLSAKSDAVLDHLSQALGSELATQPELDLNDVAYTLALGRASFERRRLLVAGERGQAVAALTQLEARHFETRSPLLEPELTFLLPGLGDHYRGMTAQLYHLEPGYRRRIDQAAELLEPHLGLDFRTLLEPAEPAGAGGDRGLDLRALLGRGERQRETSPLDSTEVAQPVVFAVELALAGLLADWGLTPRALLGYSLGEYTAATLAGVFTFEAGLELVAERARLIATLPPGAMLAVPLSAAELGSRLSAELSLAADNGAAGCVVAGTADEVEALSARLASEGVVTSRVRTHHAFHSPLLAPIVERFKQLVARCRPSPPRLPLISNLSGTWLTAEEAVDPGYWGRHLVETLRFAAGLDTLAEAPSRVLLEVGPGSTLLSLARQQAAAQGRRLEGVATVRAQFDQQPDLAFLLTAVGRLWAMGAEVDWASFHGGAKRRRVRLPTYPFDRQSYWFDSRASAPAASSASREARDFLYLPLWKQAPWLTAGARPTAGRVLILGDPGGVGGELAALLGDSAEVSLLAAGDQAALNHHLAGLSGALAAVVDLRPLPPAGAELGAETTFLEVVRLAQALVASGRGEALTLWVVSSGLARITGQETLEPRKATLLGACRTIPQQYLHLRLTSIDLDWGELSGPRRPAVLARLVRELASVPNDLEVALRTAGRFVLGYERPALPETVSPRLPPGAVVWITGGLGSIGLALARALVERWRARLVLTGRRALPPRAEWPQLAAAEVGDEAGRLRTLLELEALGAEVLVEAADVGDEASMRRVVAAARARFGGLDGVIHAAGVLTPDSLVPIRDVTAASCQTHFHSKVQGTEVLARVLSGEPVRFVLLMSSISAIVGGLGFAPYAAANLFMDAFATWRCAEGEPWVSVNWDTWAASASGANTLAHGAGSAAEPALSTADAIELFERILSFEMVPRVVTSMADLEARISRWVHLDRTRGEAGVAAEPSHERPAVGSAYVAPRDETEQDVVDFWGTLLGIRGIGVEDNFFELGGNSLLATQLFARLRERFGVDLGLANLFAAPTPAELAQLITAHRWVVAPRVREHPSELVEGEL